MITNNNSIYVGEFGHDHDVFDNSEERKLTEQNRYPSMDVVSRMLDEAYYRDKEANTAKQTSDVAVNIIDELSNANLSIVRSYVEEADRLRSLALFYRNKGKYEKALIEWEKLEQLLKDHGDI